MYARTCLLSHIGPWGIMAATIGDDTNEAVGTLSTVHEEDVSQPYPRVEMRYRPVKVSATHFHLRMAIECAASPRFLHEVVDVGQRPNTKRRRRRLCHRLAWHLGTAPPPPCPAAS
ncbi:hypothetical protein K491DRAFT_182560 [Lophiostoma macrostomum CBS 122681]|uniref:Uncharacterized protein n=1 Tax=Lophiostoma macrostomum CBS 122681 TaxID=1314788 RepID=A0A6A6TUC7_9PLEO|nr:hypothetical protein K491DRAFT_182560 [Lophiostoma macrostomum CBS 122681]